MTAGVEFSRPIAVDRIGRDGLVQRVEATAPECAALAARLRIPAVLAFACTFRLARADGGRITATAHLDGRLVRECVVSLDPFETDIAEDFSVVFVPEDRLSAELDLEGDDEIPYSGGVIDLGEAAAEQAALTLDPYPRRPGAVLPETATEAPHSPFAMLASRRTPH
jgi:uncharacterized metal-binding protein YceD (DUF177 family)